jgi:hypothetical protein
MRRKMKTGSGWALRVNFFLWRTRGRRKVGGSLFVTELICGAVIKGSGRGVSKKKIPQIPISKTIFQIYRFQAFVLESDFMHSPHSTRVLWLGWPYFTKKL